LLSDRLEDRLEEDDDEDTGPAVDEVEDEDERADRMLSSSPRCLFSFGFFGFFCSFCSFGSFAFLFPRIVADTASASSPLRAPRAISNNERSSSSLDPPDRDRAGDDCCCCEHSPSLSCTHVGQSHGRVRSCTARRARASSCSFSQALRRYVVDSGAAGTHDHAALFPARLTGHVLVRCTTHWTLPLVPLEPPVDARTVKLVAAALHLRVNLSQIVAVVGRFDAEADRAVFRIAGNRGHDDALDDGDVRVAKVPVPMGALRGNFGSDLRLRPDSLGALEEDAHGSAAQLLQLARPSVFANGPSHIEPLSCALPGARAGGGKVFQCNVGESAPSRLAGCSGTVEVRGGGHWPSPPGLLHHSSDRPGQRSRV
jgi:hypothetical protein